MTARWRKQPSEKGLARVVQGLRGFDLAEKGEIIIQVRPLYQGFGREVKGWYWYGLGKNTATAPKTTPDEAKAEAMAHFKAVTGGK